MRSDSHYLAPSELPEWLRLARGDSLVSVRDMLTIFKINDGTLSKWEQKGWLPPAIRMHNCYFVGSKARRPKKFWTAACVRQLLAHLKAEGKVKYASADQQST